MRSPFFERAIALDPGYARAHMHLGAALDLKADYLGIPDLAERALASLERALELAPEFGRGLAVQGGRPHLPGSRRRGARRPTSARSPLNPTDAAAHSGLGRVHFILRGDFAAAIRGYERRWP